MYTHTKFDHAFDYRQRPAVTYFVCSTPRCGSSVLCEALCLTEMAGVPTEYFDAETREGFSAAWQVQSDDYLPTLLRKKTTPNGVFGCKTHFHQYQEAFGIEALPQLGSSVRYIWLSRRDVIRQAVSYWKAIETNQWATTHQCLNESPRFDFEQIDRLRKQIEYEQSQWQLFFDRHAIEPLRITYEEAVGWIPDVVAECFRYLSLDPSRVPSEFSLTLKKQADALSEEWVRLYQTVASARPS